MYHMLLHKAQTQEEVIFITGFLVQRQSVTNKTYYINL